MRCLIYILKAWACAAMPAIAGAAPGAAFQVSPESACASLPNRRAPLSRIGVRLSGDFPLRPLTRYVPVAGTSGDFVSVITKLMSSIPQPKNTLYMVGKEQALPILSRVGEVSAYIHKHREYAPRIVTACAHSCIQPCAKTVRAHTVNSRVPDLP
jgi:hypothetical protein